jgi:hypothetical protein
VVSANVGPALQKAMRGIEKANPEALYGIVVNAAWTNKDRLPDSLLRDLLEHFSLSVSAIMRSDGHSRPILRISDQEVRRLDT